ncbi:PREDICTED: disease resistance protein RPP5-like [Camelina sativa]|uniref:Disease resistance protein RPP5-like n=1 Tax=Camelina sativa TaxID=90675 RepID=A0ABM1QY47_CAMSA|nr:PREDICTED: disease resistance protein RPP5-like [Camelina sativa]
MVEEIVKVISRKLFSMLPTVPEDIVGMEAHLAHINPLLDMNIHIKNDEARNQPSDNDTNTKEDKVRMIGIWGMGGIGKTAIARHLYEQHKKYFSSHHCFIHKISSAQHDLLYLQKQLLSNILGEEDLKFQTIEQGASYIHSRLRNLKALVVLDDVDDVKQVNALAKVGWFGPGSRIIITTRDKSLLRSSRVTNVYKVKYLDDDIALQLFQRIAFKGRNPPRDRDYQHLSERFCRLSQGLPLALVTFGFHLHDKSLGGWQDALKMFEEAPHEEIMTVLKTSYDKLDKVGKTAFLHVACLFNGDPVERVITLLERGRAGMKVLVDMSLIDISADGRIAMHPLLEQTGRQIVLQESENSPAKQRILWQQKEICRVLEDNAYYIHQGTSKTEAMALDVSEPMSSDFHIKWNMFKPMHNLSYLKINRHSVGLESRREDLILEKKWSIPHKLRFLHWDAYPFTTLSTNISPDCLVELNLCYSKLKRLWSGTPRLLHLRKLDLTGSKDLKELPDLQEAVCLEELILEGCTSLKQIPKSICSLSKLQKFDVSNCDGLTHLRIKITESLSTVIQDTSLSVRAVYLKFFSTETFVEDSQGISLENPSIKGNLKLELKLLKGYAEHLCFTSEKRISRELMKLELESPPYVLVHSTSCGLTATRREVSSVLALPGFPG